MNTVRSIVSAAVAAATLAPAAGADDTGWYASAVAGINTLGSETIEYRNGATVESSDADFDASFAGGATFGYRLSPQWRIESELMYRRNELSDFGIPSFPVIDEGDFASLSIAFSGLYDFDLFGQPSVRSYVGAGVVFIQEIDIDFETAGIETSFETDDIGLQLHFGARYDFGERWFADAGIRYLLASDIEMALPDDGTQTVTADYAPLSLSVGFGVRF